MESKLKVIEALQKIQSELKAPKGQKNNFGNYMYRSCEDILEAVKPFLKEHKCALVVNDEMVCLGDNHPVVIARSDEQTKDGNILVKSTIGGGARFYVKATATLYCENESISANGFARESKAKKGMDDSQITGASSSYARKYALNGLFAIDDTKDADTD